MFKENPRNSTLLMGFVLTDGICSRENQAVLSEKAKELHASNITLYALGVGNKTSLEELRRIAGVSVKPEANNDNEAYAIEIDINDIEIEAKEDKEDRNDKKPVPQPAANRVFQ